VRRAALPTKSMPGIHPSSRKQVKWAFAAEARGQLRPSPATPWTSPEAKSKGSIAREWAHRLKCWEWDEKVRGKMPADCKSALELLDTVRREHPSWKVPAGVTRPAPRPTVVPIRKPPVRRPEERPERVAAGRGEPTARRRPYIGNEDMDPEAPSPLEVAVRVMNRPGLSVQNKIGVLERYGYDRRTIDRAIEISAGARENPFEKSRTGSRPAKRPGAHKTAAHKPAPQRARPSMGSPEKARKPSKSAKPSRPRASSNVMTADDLVREAMRKYA